MDREHTFRLAFWLLFGLFIAMRTFFAVRVIRAGERLRPDRAALKREGWTIGVLRWVAFLTLIAMVTLIVRHPAWWSKFALPLPDFVRWTGVLLNAASLGFWTWTHLTLGTLWSAQLQLRAGHRLVTCGPYAKIRHPMYTAILAWLLGIGLILSNALIFLLMAPLIVILVGRVPREEQMMLDHFGDAYRDYMSRAGRFLPKWT